MILAIDTTHEFGSLALVHAGELLEEVPLHAPDGFGQVLFSHIGRLLQRRGIPLTAIDCFAAASGPGSFTGVRIGLACVKGLAEALGRRVVPVSNLKAMAWYGNAPVRAVFLDARRGEIYGGVYSDSLEILAPEVVTKFPAWLDSIHLPEVEFLTSDFAPFLPAIESSPHAAAPRRPTPRALAAAIALIAESGLRAGRALDPAAVDANYIRRSDAELAGH